MPNNALPEFQQFLLSRGLVPEKKILYYAHWVSKFLALSNSNENLNYDLSVQKFLDELRSQTNTADWQIIQAEEALALYSGHFLKGDTSVLSPNMPQGGKKLPDLPQALDEMRQAIRIKHYSYSTEHSYLDWVKRFYDYTLNIKKKDGVLNMELNDLGSTVRAKRGPKLPVVLSQQEVQDLFQIVLRPIF